MRLICRLIPFLLLPVAPFVFAQGVAQSLAAPGLSSDTDVATSGFFRLAWHAAPGLESELQEARSPDFDDAQRRYYGTDRARFVSGKADGRYYYRVRTFNDEHPSPWSQAVVVEVRHHPLWRAVGFFALGALVFLATVWLVLRRPRESG